MILQLKISMIARLKTYTVMYCNQYNCGVVITVVEVEEDEEEEEAGVFVVLLLLL